MKSLSDVFSGAFSLLKKEPKLFLPKIAIAFLFGTLMIFSSDAIVAALNAVYSGNTSAAVAVLPRLVFLLGLSFLSLIADLAVNAMYSFIVKDYFSGKKIRLLAAFRESLGRILVTAPAVLSSELIILASTIPFSLAISFFLVRKDLLMSAISAIAMLAVFVFLNALFFLVYPVSALKSRNFFAALAESVVVSKKHLGRLSLMSIVSTVISLVSIALSFFAGNPAAFLAFALLRLVVAMLATYSILLNPVFYVEFQRDGKNVLPEMRKRKRPFR